MMNSVLLITGKSTETSPLCQLLSQAGLGPVTTAANISEAHRLASCHNYGLILISSPLPYGSARELCLWCLEHTSAGILMLVEKGFSSLAMDRISLRGAAVLQKPVNRILLAQTAIAAVSGYSRTTKLQRKLEDQKLLGRAKCVLMHCLGMTEPQAHRYIEKQAMDRRCRRLRVAQDILHTYETPERA